MKLELELGFSPVFEALIDHFECSDEELKKVYTNWI